MQRRPVHDLTLVGAPALSRAGNLLWWMTVAWLLVGPIAASVTLGPRGPTSPADPPEILILLSVTFGPWIVMSWFPRWLGRFLLFRWILAPTQPAAALDELGLTLSTPEAGHVRFAWDEIARFGPDDDWFRRSIATNVDSVDLSSPDGRVLMRVPPSLYGRLSPAGSRWRSGPRTLAEHVVAARPDRFRFLEAERLPYLWFTLNDPGASQPDRPIQDSTGTRA